MAITEHTKAKQGGEIYTLAQSGTKNNSKNHLEALVKGQGTEIIENPSLEMRAKRKVVTNKMVLSLIDVAKEKGDFDRVQSYRNAYYCQSNVVISGSKLYGDYCKNRFCTICTAIRKAEIINKYHPTISQWEDVHFVTLTVKSCKADMLNKWIWRMNKAFNLIHNRCKKRHQRGKGIKLIGVKSLECNFNPKSRTYNPHFHIIVPSLEVAQLLRREWMKQWRPTDKRQDRYKYTYPKAQHIKKVDDLKHTLIETIKYGSKIFTEPDLKKKGKQSTSPFIYVYALDNILAALKGIRLFERFGFNLPPQEVEISKEKWVSNFDEWVFSSEGADWINPDTGECLTGYLQPPELSHLLNECLNTTLY